VKPLRLFVALLFASVTARADLVIEETIEAGGGSVPATIKVKGDLLRIETHTVGGASAACVLVNLTTGAAAVLDLERKSSATLDLASVKSQARTLGGAIEKPVASGKTEKIGNWTAEIYETHSGPVAFKMWVAKDLPNFASLQEQLGKLSQAGAAPADLAQFQLPGIVVKTEISGPQGAITSTVLSIQESPVADRDLTIPPDFQKASSTGLPAPIPY
jgi:Domain of unknown function (DUF4412)